MPELPALYYLLLVLAGFGAGFIDAVAGGGGLISAPALLAVGLPPQVMLGTNKLQACCGTVLAVRHYYKAGLMRHPYLWTGVALSFAASVAGALTVSVLSAEFLKKMIPWMLAAVAVYTALNRKFGVHPGREKMSPLPFAIIFGTLLGFYDGFFGPGAGSFWMVALVGLMGLELLPATGYTKAVNLASNMGALLFFAYKGSIHYPVAMIMIVGQLAGSHLGAKLTTRKGAPFIRPVFLTVVFAMTLKLLWDAWKG
jgi:uncharacterized protein